MTMIPQMHDTLYGNPGMAQGPGPVSGGGNLGMAQGSPGLAGGGGLGVASGSPGTAPNPNSLGMAGGSPGVAPQPGGLGMAQGSPGLAPGGGGGTNIAGMLQQLNNTPQAIAAMGGGNPSNPLQPTYAPTPVTGQATLFQGAQLGDPNSLLGGFLSPQNTIQQLLQGFAPQAAQAQNGLQQQLAAMGISGGAAVNAQNQLQQQLTQALAPSIAGAIQNSQGNTLSALGQNAGLLQQAGLSNQNAMNQFTGQNLQNWNNWQNYNTGLANNANNELAQMLEQAYMTNLGAFQNVNLAGLSGSTSLANTGLNGSNNLASQQANNFPIMQSPFSGLGTTISQAFGGNSGQPANSQWSPVPGSLSTIGIPTQVPTDNTLPYGGP